MTENLTREQRIAIIDDLRRQRRELSSRLGHTRIQRALRSAELTPVNSGAFADVLYELADALTGDPQMGEYLRQEEAIVAEANRHIDILNEEVRAAYQAKVNEREAARTRAAMCESCFTLHAGECY